MGGSSMQGSVARDRVSRGSVSSSLRGQWGRLRLLGALLAVFALLLSGCGSEEQVVKDPEAKDFGVVRIGSGYIRETRMVAYLYSGILEQAGYETEVVDTGSTRQEALEAMQREENPVMILPDYSGNLLLYLTSDGRVNPQATQTTASAQEPGGESSGTTTPSSSPTQAFNVHGMSSTDILDTLPSVLPEDLDTLDASPAQNKDALVVTRATAARYGLSTIADLAEHCGQLSFGVPEGFPERGYGSSGLRNLYDCVPGEFVQEDDQSALVGKLISEEVDVADVYTASSAISTNNLVVLEDPQANFIAQQLVPVVRADELPSTAMDAINSVSGSLDTDDLRFLDQLMQGEDPVEPEDAARFWLEDGRG